MIYNLWFKDYNYAIVDEIDSCLIDEARTPLVINRHQRIKLISMLQLTNL